MSRSLYARLARRYGGRRVDAISRREMLKATLAGGAGLLLSGPLYGFRALEAPKQKRIAVIGAGFAGLACAHELKSAGYDVTIVEARNRVGGRVLSFGDWVTGHNVEGGAELIGSNHPTWVRYADQFGLEFLDVTEDEDAMAPIVLNGKLLSEEESNALWEQLDAIVAAMNADAAKVKADEPWNSPDAAALDARTVKAWIDAQGASDVCKHALAVQTAGNNGVDTQRQSFLGMLTQVAGGGGEAYWTESEVYRCKGGNQQLAFKLAEAIGADRIVLKLAVTKIRTKGDMMIVTCADDRTIEVDDVVLAVPPSTWKKIDIEPGIPAALAPQMGTAIKYLTQVKTKFWKAGNLASDSLTDGPVSMTWDGTDNQPGDSPAELTAFSGGPAAEKCLSWQDKADADANFAKELEVLYPGYGENRVDTRFMTWPREPWTMGGYSCPAPGQVTTVGPMLRKGLGRLHFAGEHCCYAFVGYMEGALNSGTALAMRLAKRDGVLEGAGAR